MPGPDCLSIRHQGGVTPRWLSGPDAGQSLIRPTPSCNDCVGYREARDGRRAPCRISVSRLGVVARTRCAHALKASSSLAATAAGARCAAFAGSRRTPRSFGGPCRAATTFRPGNRNEGISDWTCQGAGSCLPVSRSHWPEDRRGHHQEMPDHRLLPGFAKSGSSGVPRGEQWAR